MCLTIINGFPVTTAASDSLSSPISEISKDSSLEQFIAPDIVKETEIIERGYVGRIKEAENDLNTFVFQNEDGTNTVRVYSHPVKYIDSVGNIRDISLDIKANTNGSYTTADHEIKTTFEKLLTEGITLEYNNIKLLMIPNIHEKANAAASDDLKTVTYSLDSKTAYEYSLTYAGFKEDIVVSEYTGQTKYEFTIYTDGLSLHEEYGSYYLMDANGDIQATIGDIIVFTADERNNTMGSMTYETIVENEEYLLTIHLDEEYLKDEKTAYPIRIDPTIEVNYGKNGTGAIEDVTINSADGSDGSSGSLFVGKRSSYGISRTLMRFPGLNLSPVQSADHIKSATVELRDLLCEGTAMTVYCYAFTGNTWKESTANWSNVSPNSFGSALSSAVVSYSNGATKSPIHTYSFDITSAVKGWKSGSYLQSKGIIFKASSSVESGSTYINKTFSSYNRSEYRPSLTVNYNAAISLNYSSATISEGSTRTLTAVTMPSGQNVTWTSLNTTVATVSSSGVVTGKKAGTATIRASFTLSGTTYYTYCTVYVTIPNGVYYIQSKNSNYYLTTNGKTSGLPDVYQYSKYSTSYLETTRIRQMWKIKYLGNGLYSVRPLN